MFFQWVLSSYVWCFFLFWLWCFNFSWQVRLIELMTIEVISLSSWKTNTLTIWYEFMWWFETFTSFICIITLIMTCRKLWSSLWSCVDYFWVQSCFFSRMWDSQMIYFNSKLCFQCMHVCLILKQNLRKAVLS